MGRFACGFTIPQQKLVGCIALLIFLFAPFCVQASSNVLTLQQAVSRAIKCHPLVESAIKEELSSQIAVKKQEAAYNFKGSASWQPVTWLDGVGEPGELTLGKPLTVTGSLQTVNGLGISAVSRYQQEGFKDPEDSDLELRIGFVLWPSAKNETGYQALLDAREAARIAELNKYLAQANAVVDTYRRYRLLQINAARLEIYKKEYEEKLRIYRQTLQKKERGLASQSDVLQAKIERDQSRAVYQRAVRDHKREMQELMVDLGLGNGEGCALEPLPERLTAGCFDMAESEVVSRSLDNSVSLLEKKQALASAKRKLQAAQADTGLEVSLQGNVRYNGEWEQPSYGGSMIISYDFADGGLRALEKREASLAYAQAKEAVDEERERVRADILKKLSDLKWFEDQKNIARVNYERTKLEYEVKDLQMKKGLAAKAEFIRSSHACEKALLDWFEAVVSYEAARLELMVMTGNALDIEGGAPVEVE